MKVILRAVLIVFLLKSSCFSGEADVVGVRVERIDPAGLQVWVTVQHDDDGWDHYADRWEILDLEGNLLDTRVLLHPHSPEPFTRSIPKVTLPPTLRKIKIRAHDSVHGYGGKEMVVDVPS